MPKQVEIIKVTFKDKMKTALNWAATTICVVMVIDVIVVLFTMLQIGNGGYTPHIAFWDEQVRLIVKVMPR